jgi:hypothetical protein
MKKKTVSWDSCLRAHSRLVKKHVKKENGEAQVILLLLRIRRIRSLRNPLLLQIQTDAEPLVKPKLTRNP